MTRFTLVLIVALLYGIPALSEEPLAFLRRVEKEAANGEINGVFRLCRDWCATADESPQLARTTLLAALKAEFGNVPYRWEATMLASRPEVWSEVSGAEFVAQTVLNVRGFTRGRPEILLRDKSLRFDAKQWPVEFGDLSPVPYACLDGDRCYLCRGQRPGRELQVQSLDIDTEQPIWTSSVPLVCSTVSIVGMAPQDGFLDVTFVTRARKRRMLMWHHYMWEFAFIALDCNTGDIDCWWSSEVQELIERTRRGGPETRN